jgi:hypothetical protein
MKVKVAWLALFLMVLSSPLAPASETALSSLKFKDTDIARL